MPDTLPVSVSLQPVIVWNHQCNGHPSCTRGSQLTFLLSSLPGVLGESAEVSVGGVSGVPPVPVPLTPPAAAGWPVHQVRASWEPAHPHSTSQSQAQTTRGREWSGIMV